MEIELITKRDLEEFGDSLIAQIRNIFTVAKEPENETLLNTQQAMKELGIKSYGTIISYTNSGLLSKRKIGAHNFYLKSEIEKLKK
jgi:hypothetical protein